MYDAHEKITNFGNLKFGSILYDRAGNFYLFTNKGIYKANSQAILGYITPLLESEKKKIVFYYAGFNMGNLLKAFSEKFRNENF